MIKYCKLGIIEIQIFRNKKRSVNNMKDNLAKNLQDSQTRMDGKQKEIMKRKDNFTKDTEITSLNDKIKSEQEECRKSKESILKTF